MRGFIMDKYKLRLFFKPKVSENQASGKIEIKTGSMKYCVEQIKANKGNLSRAIIEVTL
jgi:hypothetical protein